MPYASSSQYLYLIIYILFKPLIATSWKNLLECQLLGVLQFNSNLLLCTDIALPISLQYSTGRLQWIYLLAYSYIVSLFDVSYLRGSLQFIDIFFLCIVSQGLPVWVIAYADVFLIAQEDDAAKMASRTPVFDINAVFPLNRSLKLISIYIYYEIYYQLFIC